MVTKYTLEEAGRKLEQLEQLSKLLDDAVKLPGTNFGVGLDGLIGLVPGLGDVITGAIALYIVREGQKIAPGGVTTAVMLANVAVDVVVGFIPAVGDLFDFAFRANKRNVAIIRQAYEKRLEEESANRQAA